MLKDTTAKIVQPCFAAFRINVIEHIVLITNFFSFLIVADDNTSSKKSNLLKVPASETPHLSVSNMKSISSKSVSAQKVVSATIYSSDFCELKNWEYNFQNDNSPDTGYNDCLCIVFVRLGQFLFDLSKQAYNMHAGHLVIDKPNYEYGLRPAAGQCTIFNFHANFYKQFLEDLNLKGNYFFSNENMLSLMLKSSPEIDYLHHQIVTNKHHAGKLEMDQLVLDMLQQVVAAISNEVVEVEVDLSLKTHHLGTIEKAKEFIHQKFSTDISLFEIAEYSCVSPFHFSRIFKKFTSYAPHNYLQNVRLKHGEVLLKNSRLPVSDISFQSGFNTTEYFATAFKQKFKFSPSQYRLKYM